MKTSWCDKLASTPAIGVFLDRRHQSSASALDLLAPILDKWITDEEDDPLTVAKQDTFSVELSSDSGFHYGVDPRKVFIEYRHKLRLKARSADVPTVEMLSKPAPYTKLLADLSERLVEGVGLLNPGGQRLIKRIGVVSTTTVDEQDAPPGVLRLLKYLFSPVGKSVPAFSIQMVAVVSENEKWKDRCTYELTRKDEPESLITVKFDYQRIFNDTRKVGALADSLRLVSDSALDYFEDIALGSRFHADAVR